MVYIHVEKSPKMLEVTFWIRMLTMILRMMIVMSRSRGVLKSEATSCFLGSLSVRNTLTFIEDKEKREASDAEKKEEKRISAHRKTIRSEITEDFLNQYRNKL